MCRGRRSGAGRGPTVTHRPSDLRTVCLGPGGDRVELGLVVAIAGPGRSARYPSTAVAAASSGRPASSASLHEPDVGRAGELRLDEFADHVATFAEEALCIRRPASASE